MDFTINRPAAVPPTININVGGTIELNINVKLSDLQSDIITTIRESLTVIQNNSVSVLRLIQLNQETTMATFADIQADLTSEGDLIKANDLLLTTISQMMKDAQASNDPAAMQAVIDGIDANKAALAASVVANTPAAPPGNPQPPVIPPTA